MKIKTILQAAVAAVTFTIGAVSAADAMPYHSYRGPAPITHHALRPFVDHRLVYGAMRARHLRYFGNPHFVRGHYVIRSADRFGRSTFVEINPYTGAVIGFIRL
jgi:hypothetical protein